MIATAGIVVILMMPMVAGCLTFYYSFKASKMWWEE